jgi:hypothetical protein
MPAAALGEERVLPAQLHARLIAFGLLAFAVDAYVSGRDALDSIVVVEHFGGGKPRKDVDAERFCLLPEPAAHVAQADDVVAVVLEAGRQQETGRLQRGFLGEEKEPVLGYRGGERRALLSPGREQLV